MIASIIIVLFSFSLLGLLAWMKNNNDDGEFGFGG